MSPYRLLILLTFLAIPSLAKAETQVCNRTPQRLGVVFALSYLPWNAGGDMRHYQSQGWRVLSAGQCSLIEDSGNRRIWVAAMRTDGTYAEVPPGDLGSKALCVDERLAFDFDEGRLPGVHTPQGCADRRGKLQKMFEYLGQGGLFTIAFTTDRRAPTKRYGEPVPARPKPAKEPPPIWERYGDFSDK